VTSMRLEKFCKAGHTAFDKTEKYCTAGHATYGIMEKYLEQGTPHMTIWHMSIAH